MLAIKRFAVSAGLVVAGMLALAQPASASWLEQFGGNPPGASLWSLNAVSCTSPTACMSVGTQSGSGGSTLAESFNGTTWSVVSIPDPGAGNLDGISCTSATSCEAVGSWVNGSSITVTLAEVWNGSTWSIQSTPNPSGATNSSLSDVSCKTASSCEAVGSSFDGTTTTALAEHWNGSTWSVQATPGTGATSAQFNGVSCPNASDCEAVGSSGTGPGITALAEVWNGSTWTIQATPSGSGFLNGVSCTSATACTAVGSDLAERWNGTSWALQTIKGNKDTSLGRVSCTDAKTCMAVGVFFQDGVEEQQAEQWNGTKWTLLSVPISASSDSQGFFGLSCTFATQCTAVGFYHDPTLGNRALIENWTIRWSFTQPSAPTGSLGSSLDAISCATTTACQAVGNAELSGSVFTPVVEGWNGSGWNLETVPNPDISNLSGVSCSAAKACTAVGDFSAGGGNLDTLALRWNGTTWTAQSTPNPSGGVRDFLTRASCSSATSCMAVGFDTDSSGNSFLLAESWNGTSWSLLSTPNPSGSTTAQFNGVSCVSATDCEAVASDNSGAWAEVWNGSTWTVQTTPTPSGGSHPGLSGVSCTSATQCAAVGSYNTGTKDVPLAEIWNGTNWIPEAPAVPSGSVSGLQSVSCNATPFNVGCSAVGDHFSGGVTSAFAEWFNGTNWQVKPVQQPNGFTRSNLSSVSCTSQTACVSVGFWEDNTGFDAPMGQLYS